MSTEDAWNESSQGRVAGHLLGGGGQTHPAVLTELPLQGHDFPLEWAEFGIKGQEGVFLLLFPAILSNSP